MAAALLALTPAHVIHSRMAADYLFPLPFMLGWLACLLRYRETSRERDLSWSTICLGVGLYSYAASPIVMPIYLLLTFVVLAMDRRPPRAYVIAAAGVIVPAALALPWLFLHPSMLAEALERYELNTGGGVTALQSLRSSFSMQRVGDQMALYWVFFTRACCSSTAPPNRCSPRAWSVSSCCRWQCCSPRGCTTSFARG